MFSPNSSLLWHCDLDVATDELADELPEDLVPLFTGFEEFYVGKKNRRIGNRNHTKKLKTIQDTNKRIKNVIVDYDS